MPKRHRSAVGSWQALFGRLEELVLANSGEDEFQEVFKLLLAKIVSETRPDGQHLFRVWDSPGETARQIDNLLATAAARWKGIMIEAPTSRLSPEHLVICVEALQSFSIRNSTLEALDGLFEYLISKSSKGAKGQYFTPRHVVEACVRIADPSPDELVLDPACGSSGFLIHTFRRVVEENPDLNPRRYAEGQLWGCDIDHRAIQVAKALMLIAGDGHTNLLRLNSLLTSTMEADLFNSTNDEGERNHLSVEDFVRARLRNFKGFDLILTNPPFAGEVRERALLNCYSLAKSPGRNERDILFLERCIRLLRPGGRFAIVLPHNKLGGRQWGYAREWLLRHVRLVAVLGLGRHTFLPHTHQKADVLFGKKRERPVKVAPRDERILFLVSERDGKDSKGEVVERPGALPEAPLWVRADHDLEAAVEAFKGFIRANDIAWGS
jgi:type I restriction enzyme M protein